jgi:hypothetical protein
VLGDREDDDIDSDFHALLRIRQGGQRSSAAVTECAGKFKVNRPSDELRESEVMEASGASESK